MIIFGSPPALPMQGLQPLQRTALPPPPVVTVRDFCTTKNLHGTGMRGNDCCGNTNALNTARLAAAW